MSKLTKDTLFKPSLSRTESKSKTTDEAARAIIAEESAKRERKTERLKALRLAKEAEEHEQKQEKTAQKKKTASAPSRRKSR